MLAGRVTGKSREGVLVARGCCRPREAGSTLTGASGKSAYILLVGYYHH